MTRNLILLPNVLRFFIRLGSNWFSWFVIAYSIVPENIPELLDVSCSSARYSALFMFWLSLLPKENKSKTIGWESFSFEILPEVPKLISTNTDKVDGTDSIDAIAVSLIWTKPFPDIMVPGAMICTDDVPGNPPKCKVMLVSENELIPSCFWNDLKS